MEILELRALRGPSIWSRYPVIHMLLDLGEMETQPSDKVEGFYGRTTALMPTLVEHRCSVGTKGGFLQRIERGHFGNAGRAPCRPQVQQHHLADKTFERGVAARKRIDRRRRGRIDRRKQGERSVGALEGRWVIFQRCRLGGAGQDTGEPGTLRVVARGLGARRPRDNTGSRQGQGVGQSHLLVTLQQPDRMIRRAPVDPVAVGEGVAPQPLVPFAAEEPRARRAVRGGGGDTGAELSARPDGR